MAPADVASLDVNALTAADVVRLWDRVERLGLVDRSDDDLVSGALERNLAAGFIDEATPAQIRRDLDEYGGTVVLGGWLDELAYRPTAGPVAADTPPVVEAEPLDGPGARAWLGAHPRAVAGVAEELARPGFGASFIAAALRCLP